MKETKCPFCQSYDVIEGRLTVTEDLMSFVPSGIKKFEWTFTPYQVRVGPDAQMCKLCGKVWSHADVVKLREVLETWSKSKDR